MFVIAIFIIIKKELKQKRFPVDLTGNCETPGTTYYAKKK